MAGLREKANCMKIPLITTEEEVENEEQKKEEDVNVIGREVEGVVDDGLERERNEENQTRSLS
jgi:hypothetical protein